jgi:hypothetical protein
MQNLITLGCSVADPDLTVFYSSLTPTYTLPVPVPSTVPVPLHTVDCSVPVLYMKMATIVCVMVVPGCWMVTVPILTNTLIG